MNLVTNFGLITLVMNMHGRLSTNLLFIGMRNLVFIDDFHGLVAGFINESMSSLRLFLVGSALI